MTHFPESLNSELLLPSAYFGPVSYYALLAKSTAKNAWIEQKETYPKQSWRNRCTILTDQGPLDLIIPVKRAQGNHTPFHLIETDNQSRWYLNHWRAITSAYNASPFFMYYRDQIEPFFKGGFDNLLEQNVQLTSMMLSLLKIEMKLLLTQDFRVPESASDLRVCLSPKKPPIFKVFPHYTQVFGDNSSFYRNLSILDVLFNLGPESKAYLHSVE